jgi:hypothetical protein
VWLLVLTACGAIAFDSAYPDHFRAAKSTDEIPEFEPVLYALDLILPVVNLNQSDS